MTAFTKAGMFKDVQLLEALEAHFVQNIEQIEGPNLVAMYCAHSSWVNGMIDECLVKKEQDKIVIKTFLKYNEAFMEKIIVNLIRNSDEINLKGTMLVLVHGNLAHIKRNANMRLMGQFAFRGVQALDRERESIGDNFEQVCVKYFEIARRYCLNNAEIDQLEDCFK